MMLRCASRRYRAGDDEEAQEKPTKVEIKGDDKTDITFAGKTAFRTKGASGWGDPVSGLLTLRRDKASGRCWMQVNSETKARSLHGLTSYERRRHATPSRTAPLYWLCWLFTFYFWGSFGASA